jgi:hypothetical protein
MKLIFLFFAFAIFLSSQYTIATVAGGGTPDGKSATSVTIGSGFSQSIATDSLGNLYIASIDQNRVFKVDASDTLTVIAGVGAAGYFGDGGPAKTAALAGPEAVAVDGLGNVYIADTGNCRIRKVSNGAIMTVAGNGSCALNPGTGQPLSSDEIQPIAIAADAAGTVYFIDSFSSSVWRIFHGSIDRFAGVGTPGLSFDGRPAVLAALNFPSSVAVDGNGVVYIAELQQHRIRSVANGIIGTVANVSLGTMAVDTAGNLFYADGGYIYRFVNGTATKIAGNGNTDYSGDGGPALSAGLHALSICTGPGGSVYIGDDGHVRRILNGVIQAVAGSGAPDYVQDGAPATDVILSDPSAVTVDSRGNLFFADSANGILKVTNGIISNVARAIIPVCFPNPCAGSLAMDGVGALYFIDSYNVLKLSRGVVSTVAGNGSPSYTGDGAATSTGLSPYSIAVSPDGDLYIVDRLVSLPIIRKVHEGVITTISGPATGSTQGDGGPAINAWFADISSMAFDRYGDLYIADSDRIRRISGGIITTFTGGLDHPVVAGDTFGNVYLFDRSSVKLLNGVRVAGGTGTGFSGDGGQATAALLSFPVGAAVGSDGKIYVADALNHRIRVLAPTPSGHPFGSFDTPTDHITGVSGAIAVTGWALDTFGTSDVGIWREPVGQEQVASNGLVFIGKGVFVTGTRPDVQAAYSGYPASDRAGWGYLLLTNFLPGNGNGTYKLHAIATNQFGSTTDLGVKTITVDTAHARKPFGTVDTPDQGGTISGSQFFNFGWALTPAPACIPNDASTITVVIDGVPIGHPVYNQKRSDIVAVFPGYCNTNGAVGFFGIDTTKLTNGIHTMSWVVYDNQGRGDGIGSRYFNIQNSGNGIAAPTVAAAEPVRLRGRRSLESLKPDSGGVRALEVQELDRIELDLDAISSGPLPVGSTLRDGVFYWQLGPGFLGDYSIKFKLANGNGLTLRVKVVPKTFPVGGAIK